MKKQLNMEPVAWADKHIAQIQQLDSHSYISKYFWDPRVRSEMIKLAQFSRLDGQRVLNSPSPWEAIKMAQVLMMLRSPVMMENNARASYTRNPHAP